jgi:glycosyltransferase involved in cell wall biosynthesis
MNPRISILMPMRNTAAYVRAALESLLAQDWDNIEIVVVDDGSTDNSAEIVRGINDPRIRLVPGPMKGIAAALNAGLEHASGELFCRCDSDDWYPPQRLGRQARLLIDRPELGAVCGTFTMVTASGKRITEQVWSNDASEISHEIKTGVGRTHFCTFMVRMEIVRRLGGFRDYFIGTEDSDFILRLGEVCKVWYEPTLAYLYRLHGESITHTQPTAQRKFLEKTMLEFQKQRLATGADDLMRGDPPRLPTSLPRDAEKTHDQVQHLLLGQAWKQHAAGQRLKAIRTGLHAVLSRPQTIGAWRSWAALVLKPSRRVKTAGGK